MYIHAQGGRFFRLIYSFFNNSMHTVHAVHTVLSGGWVTCTSMYMDHYSCMYNVHTCLMKVFTKLQHVHIHVHVLYVPITCTSILIVEALYIYIIISICVHICCIKDTIGSIPYTCTCLYVL